MKNLFYDTSLTFDENYDKGPYLLKTLAKPVFDYTKSKKTTFLGFPIHLPFGIPAGSLPNSKFIKAAFDFGFDVNVYKTQRSVTFECNQYPNILFVETNGDLTLEKAAKPLVGHSKSSKDPKEYSITNSFGNPSRGPKVWKKDMRRALTYEKPGQLLIGSVVGTIQEGFSEEDYHDDFAKAAKMAKETGVKVIEINLSCPNVANEGILCYSLEAVEQITQKVKKALGNTPLVVKVGYYSNKQQELLAQIMERIAPFIAAISAINTIPAPVVDDNGQQALPGPNRLKAGICGAGVKWAGLDMVKRLNELRKKNNYSYEIIGVGGVMTPEDYKQYRDAGAQIVQSATGAMWNPYLAKEISEHVNNRELSS